MAFYLQSCNNNTPQQYFNIAVLNSNMLYRFAGNGMQRELEGPSEKLVDEKTMITAPMKRAEVIKDKLQFIESSYQKIKELGSNEDAAAMVKASLTLYEFVLPVCKNEYAQLAIAYDESASADKIADMEKTIQNKYAATFDELYNALHTTAMAYAAKHGINVREVNPAPTQ